MKQDMAIAAPVRFSTTVRVTFLLFANICLLPTPVSAQPTNLHSPRQADSESAFQRGLTALKENRLDDALESFTQAETEHPDDPLVRNFRGITLARLGNNAEAAAAYREALRLNPQFADAYRNLGFLQWTEHQTNLASESLQRAVQLAPSDSYAHYYLGRVDLDAKRYELALHELQTSRVPLPTDADFELQLASAHLALGQHEEARKVLAYLATISIDDAQSIRLASLFLALHQNSEAVATIEKLIPGASFATDSWRQFDLALVNLLSGNYAKAVAQADQLHHALTQQNPAARESAATWTIIAVAAAHLKQTNQSLSAFRRAATLKPANEEYWLNLTRELMELSRFSEALLALQDALAANPKSYALHLRLGAAQLAAGHYPEAESGFRELVAAGDPLPTSYVGLAQVLIRTGRPEEAAAELAAAEKTVGSNFLFSYFRGLALDRANRPREAASAFSQAIALDPTNAEAHFNLGKTELNLAVSADVHVDLEKTSPNQEVTPNAQPDVKPVVKLDVESAVKPDVRPDIRPELLPDAISQLRESLRLDPHNEQAKRLLSKAYGRVGDRQQATEFAQAAAEIAAPTSPEPDLLGDFFIPDWQFPRPRETN